MSLGNTYKICKEPVRNIFLKSFIEPKMLRKIRNISFSATIAIFVLALLSIFYGSFILYILYITTAVCVSSLFFLMVVELTVFFSNTVLDGNPRTPSRRAVLFAFYSFSFFAISLLLIMNPAGTHLLIAFLLVSILIAVFPYSLLKSVQGSISFLLAGRVYTYFSLSTFFFLMISSSMFSLFKNMFQIHKIYDLNLPTNPELILFVAFLIPLTLLFFWTKERIFNHYGKAIASRRTEKYSRRKEFLEETLRELLRPVPEIDETDVDKLYKRAYLIRLKIENLDQEIKKVEKEFEFHGSLTWSLITQPLWIVLIVDVIPPVFDLLKILFNV